MHLVRNYSLASAQKIDNISIREKFFPLPVKKYLCFQPFSKPSKSFDYWQDVIFGIRPELAKAGIEIVQIGGKDERIFDGCLGLSGRTSINEAAHIIKNSVMFLGADSFGSHLAGHYDLPLVCLYSNNYMENVRPYFGDKSKQILFEPPRLNGEKPSFSFEENPKTINRIKIEDIVNAVFFSLGIAAKHPYKTEFIAEKYNHRLIEAIPTGLVNVQQFGVDCIIERLDVHFDESVLANQLNLSKVIILTDRPISFDLLRAKKAQIKDLIYIVGPNHDPSFIEELYHMGIKFNVVSYGTDSEIKEYKRHYFNYATIVKPNIPTLPSGDNFYYKTQKLVLSNNKMYPSIAASKLDRPINNGFGENYNILDKEILEHPDFVKDKEFVMVVSKL